MKRCIALLAFCALSIPAFANPLDRSGIDFLAECSALDKDSGLTNIEMAKNMTCLSYVQGLIDGATYGIALTQVESKMRAQPFPFCRPEGVGNMQLLRVALKYVRDNPEKAHVETVVLVFTALKNAFPCSEKR